jgi:hypothetical protein
MGTLRNKESAKRAGLLRKMCFHWMQKNAPEELLKFRKKIDNVVRPVRRYTRRPGNEVGLER